MVVIFRWVYGRQSKGGVTERRRGIVGESRNRFITIVPIKLNGWIIQVEKKS